jgi:hypothetical protein
VNTVSFTWGSGNAKNVFLKMKNGEPRAFCHSRNPDSEPTRQQSRSWFASAAYRRETKLLFRFVQSKTSICIIRLSKKLVTRAKVGEQFFVDARLSENVASS